MAVRGTIDLSQVQVLVDGLDHPEGVNIDADGTLWAGGEAGQIYRVDPATRTFQEVGSTDGFLLGVTADGGRHVYACDIKRQAVMRLVIETGVVETVATHVEGCQLVNPNYAVFDQTGRLYVTESGHWLENDGFIFSIEPDGTTRIVDERPRNFPNGLALDDERSELYIIESTLPGITKLKLGSGEFETVVELPGTVPDGLALDAERALYVGCYRPDTILRVKDGEVDVLLDDPQGTAISAPANLAFGGPDRQTLYIASLGRWHLGMVHLDTPGLPLCFPAQAKMGGFRTEQRAGSE
jgi:gluconolactonase